MLVTYYDLDGQEVQNGAFNLLTKSLYKAIIEVELITGFKLKRISFNLNWALMHKDNKRILVSAV
jgi:hypothetical protein